MTDKRTFLWNYMGSYQKAVYKVCNKKSKYNMAYRHFWK